MKEYIVRALVLSALFVISSQQRSGIRVKAAVASSTPSEALMSLSVKDLTARAHALVERSELDSAMFVFAITGNKYRDGMADSEKRMAVHALKNAGALCCACSNDYAVSYRYLQRALELAEQNGFRDMLPDIEMHLANLYSLFDESGTESVELLRKCYHTSLAGKDYNIMTLAFINLYVIGYDGDVGEFSAIASGSIPEDVRMGDYARHLYRGVEALQASRYDEARLEFRKMHGCIDDTLGLRRSACLMNKLTAGSFEAQGVYDSAVVYYDRLRAVAGSADLQSDVIRAYRGLAACYNNMGDDRMAGRMHIRYLEKKDSMSTTNNLNSLNNMRRKSEIDKIERQMEKMSRNKQRQEYILFFVAVIASIVVVFLFIQYVQNKRLRSLNRFLYNKTQEMMAASQTPKPTEATVHNTVTHDTVIDGAVVNDTGIQNAVTQNTGALEKYQSSNISEAKKDEIRRQVDGVMSDTELICSPDFTLSKLAQLIDSNTVYVSQVVNECYGVSFSVLLSNSRIHEAIRRFDDTETYGNLTIEAISRSVGFRSRASFVKSFRSVTGLTPSEYLREARSKNSQ